MKQLEKIKQKQVLFEWWCSKNKYNKRFNMKWKCKRFASKINKKWDSNNKGRRGNVGKLRTKGDKKRKPSGSGTNNSSANRKNKPWCKRSFSCKEKPRSSNNWPTNCEKSSSGRSVTECCNNKKSKSNKNLCGRNKRILKNNRNYWNSAD